MLFSDAYEKLHESHVAGRSTKCVEVEDIKTEEHKRQGVMDRSSWWQMNPLLNWTAAIASDQVGRGF